MEASSKPLSQGELKFAALVCLVIAGVMLGWLDRIITG
jgi:hypothetical protein